MRRKFTLLLAILLLSSYQIAYTFADVGDTHPIPETDPQFEVTLLSVEYDEGKDEQTWTYRIKCLTDADHDISHFVFAFAEICDPPLSKIVSAGPGNPEIHDSYDKTFPHEGVSGIKFDTPVNKGESVEVSFTVEGQWAMGTMGFWIKAGQPVYSGLVSGPDCVPGFVVPEFTIGTLGPILASTLGLYISSKKLFFLTRVARARVVKMWWAHVG